MKLPHQSQLNGHIISILFIAFCLFVFFFRLDSPTIRMWDESREAMKALEMSLNGNYLVPHFNGQPDMWSTKPPLVAWLITIAMKFFGYNSFSVRLPSAIAAALTTLCIFYFGKIYFRRTGAGFICGMVLLTSIGFISEHVARTGDRDALLTLGITLYSLAFFLYLNLAKSKQIYCLTGMTIGLIIAVLTKGIAGFFGVPAIIIYAVYTRKIRQIVFSRSTYYVILAVIGTVSSYYFLRELYNPGFLNAVFQNEVLRGLVVLENHKGGPLFYLTELRYGFFPWLYFLPLVWLVFFSQHEEIKKFVIFGVIYILSFITVISVAKTKLPWYEAPVYPIASLVAGAIIFVVISQMFVFIQNRWNISNYLKSIIVGIVLCVVFFYPFYKAFYQTIYISQGIIYDWSRPSPILMYGDYFKALFAEYPSLQELMVIKEESYNAHLDFYAAVERTNGRAVEILEVSNISPTSLINLLKPNQHVITCEPEAKRFVETSSSLKAIHHKYSCSTFILDVGTRS